MSMLIGICVIFFIAILCGAVILIQMGGWLAIFVAILSILGGIFFPSAFLLLLTAEAFSHMKKKKEEESKP